MTPLQKLQDLFRELFQLDLADLDFGIYRLLRLKRDEVQGFLTEQLPRRVRETFAGMAEDERASLERSVAEFQGRIRADVAEDAILSDGEIAPDYREVKVKAARELLEEYRSARERLAAVAVTEAQQAEVFNHLYSFFSRYYEGGDFIPRRRRGAREAYAVPYNGEETFFHWANRDQHYVKTAEAFRDYAFTVDALGGPFRVGFVLTQASVLPGNVKGDTRYFFPQPGEIAWDAAVKTLRVPFHYRLPTEKEVERYGKNARLQEGIIDEAVSKILDGVPDPVLKEALADVVDRKEDEEVTLLKKRLRHFTRKQTTDYFIHKDLGGFLRRELEFYLKDQVLHIADLDGDLDAKQRTLRVVRELAHEVITFLAQIEGAQKRLFEKRKFVLRTDYLVPIMHVPRELWPEVVANENQVEVWRDLFAIDADGRLTDAFLQNHPTLVVDTKHLGDAFKGQLLESFEDIDEATDGLLVHAENYQALRLLEPRYKNHLRFVYIDPPYNTGSDGFVYKDRYRHSSWLAALSDRVRLGMRMLSPEGVFLVSIGNDELDNLIQLLRSLACEAPIPFAWRSRAKPTNAGDAIFRPQIAAEFVLLHAMSASAQFYPLRSTEERRYPHKDEHGRYHITSILTSNRGRYRRETLRFEVAGYRPPEGKRWKAGEAEIVKLYQEHRLAFNDEGEPYRKVYEEDEVKLHIPLWTYMPEKLTGTAESGKADLSAIVGSGHGFDSVKPKELIELFLRATTQSDAVLDYFAGSGTTGHAVIRVNREDGRRRKFILVEMGESFDAVLVERIQKVVYAPDWKHEKPARLPSDQERECTPRLIKVVRLESYEDALHNVAADDLVASTRDRAEAHAAHVGVDQYRLRYLLRLPLEASASMLAIDRLEHPFDYAIDLLTEDGPQAQPVDLVETFNFLYGLHVQQICTWLNEADASRSYRVVKGETRDNRRVLVLWRDMTDLDPAVERGFLEPTIQSEGPFDEILMNGDCAVPGIQSLDGIFKRLMEEGET